MIGTTFKSLIDGKEKSPKIILQGTVVYRWPNYGKTTVNLIIAQHGGCENHVLLVTHRSYSRQVTEWMECNVAIHPPPSVYPKAGNGALRGQWAIKYHCKNHRPLSDRLETAPLTAQRPQVSCARCRPATATARIRESATRSQQLDWHNCIRHWIYCLYGPQVA